MPNAYNYHPILPAERKGVYCRASRHGLTHVQAEWIEIVSSEELKLELEEWPSCNECHDSMLQAFMDMMLPEPTEDELAGLSDE